MENFINDVFHRYPEFYLCQPDVKALCAIYNGEEALAIFCGIPIFHGNTSMLISTLHTIT